MPFSYDPALGSDTDRVRFLLQDTTNTTARPNLLDNGEILWALATEANVYLAAALCAEALATRFRGLTAKSVGSLSLTYDQAAKTWGAIADRLRARGATHQILSAGGIYTADRDAIWEDADLIRPDVFSRIHQDASALPPARGFDEE
jgi:hypothetical protein